MSNKWINRHTNDYYVRESQRNGYRARSAFKLLEINTRFNIIKKGNYVLDLGAAPGSWSQIATGIVGSAGKVVAIDRLQMEPLNGVEILMFDLKNSIDEIHSILENQVFHAVLSDMAPDTIGNVFVDHINSLDLADIAVHFAQTFLVKNGNLIIKIFQGGREKEFINSVREVFKKVSFFKPKATRVSSKEIYVICQYLKR
ncbi:MAG: ribosomal RNA large subunit methyltransferase E [Candidatus Xenolissoclinum pacificiensis L6]|uniref:Ribosomal RNA large subunit methyltransferase E n=1 Tax=Candidatus Xenolissoclinum pacificiensis L6 TaxID=1401685 RepID=W2V0E3_9RICK|nr:MAG: ribosomal RNA large subunit methyltransferase E [Candidatus Xenolissoclinum pacificiensis L6]